MRTASPTDDAEFADDAEERTWEAYDAEERAFEADDAGFAERRLEALEADLRRFVAAIESGDTEEASCWLTGLSDEREPSDTLRVLAQRLRGIGQDRIALHALRLAKLFDHPEQRRFHRDLRRWEHGVGPEPGQPKLAPTMVSRIAHQASRPRESSHAPRRRRRAGTRAAPPDDPPDPPKPTLVGYVRTEFGLANPALARFLAAQDASPPRHHQRSGLKHISLVLADAGYPVRASRRRAA